MTRALLLLSLAGCGPLPGQPCGAPSSCTLEVAPYECQKSLCTGPTTAVQCSRTGVWAEVRCARCRQGPSNDLGPTAVIE